MDLSDDILKLVSTFTDGKTLDEGKLLQLAEAMKADGARARATLEAPTRTPDQDLDLYERQTEIQGRRQGEANQRIVDQSGQLYQQADDSYLKRKGGYVDMQRQLMQPGYESLDRGRQVLSDDYGKLLEYQNTNRAEDRKLQSRAQTLGLIKNILGGAAILFS
tara:strand:- start:83 stop:571 length:489 start_codon:yes stop_codon:yes gene_type:complete